MRNTAMKMGHFSVGTGWPVDFPVAVVLIVIPRSAGSKGSGVDSSSLIRFRPF